MSGDGAHGSHARAARPAGSRIVLWLCLAFAARLAFGLTSELWGDDEMQVYLIGLEYFTTGVWPLYGPDVVYTQTQIPGGLQGLLIGWPLWMVPQPEAPYVLLNLLSFAALLALGWYIGRRVPSLPRWFLWPWVLFTPWALNLSTHILNSSYVLPGAVVFCLGLFEVVPALRRGLLPRSLAFFCLGFGILWIYQLHMSAFLLGPVALAALVLAARADGAAAARGVIWTTAGALTAGASLVPTIVQDGLAGLTRTAESNVVFEPGNLLRVPQVVAQFFALPAFEVTRFIGASTDARLAFLARFWWAAPFVLCAALIGVIQSVTLLIALFQRRTGATDWPAVRALTASLLGLLIVSFVWSVRPPASHAFYLLLPPLMIYAACVWAPWFERRDVRALAAALLVCGAVTHAAIAWRNFTFQSLYTDRATVVRAIVEKNHRLVGVRRPEMWRSQP
jgi:hypothetical protein